MEILKEMGAVDFYRMVVDSFKVCSFYFGSVWDLSIEFRPLSFQLPLSSPERFNKCR